MSDVLTFLRESSPALKDVPDEDLIEFAADTMPQLAAQDPAFDAEIKSSVRRARIAEMYRLKAENRAIAQQYPEKDAALGRGVPLLDQIGIGLTQGLAQLGQAGAKGLELSARYGDPRWAGVAPIAADWSATAGQANRDLDALGSRVPGPDLARTVSAGVMSTVPTIAAAPIGFPAAVLAAGGQSFLSTYADAEDAYKAQGADAEAARRKAFAPALASGIVTAGMTTLFGKTGVENWMAGLKGRAFVGLAKSFGKEVGFEAADEWYDQMGQAAVNYLTYNPEMTLTQALTEAAEAGLSGGFAAGMMHGVAAAHGARPPAGPTPPPPPPPAVQPRVEPPAAEVNIPIPETRPVAERPDGVYLQWDLNGQPMELGPVPAGTDIERIKAQQAKAWPGAVFQGVQVLGPVPGGSGADTLTAPAAEATVEDLEVISEPSPSQATPAPAAPMPQQAATREGAATLPPGEPSPVPQAAAQSPVPTPTREEVVPSGQEEVPKAEVTPVAPEASATDVQFPLKAGPNNVGYADSLGRPVRYENKKWVLAEPAPATTLPERPTPAPVAETAKEPWQKTRREYEAQGMGLPEGSTIPQRAAEVGRKVTKALGDLLKQSGFWKKNRIKDLATRRTTIGALNEFQPHTAETALRSTKVSREAKDAYRAVVAEKKAIDEEALVEIDHRTYVERALREGKPVPAEVLADYPDLAKAAPVAETVSKLPIENAPESTTVGKPKAQPMQSDWQETARGRSIYKGDLSRENAKDDFVVAALKAAPSYPKLLAAYHRFMRGIYGKGYDPAVIDKQPWDLLDKSANVMNAKSQTAKTLATLENAVFAETKLPRSARSKRFRGGTGVKWDEVNPQTPLPKPPLSPAAETGKGSETPAPSRPTPAPAAEMPPPKAEAATAQEKQQGQLPGVDPVDAALDKAKINLPPGTLMEGVTGLPVWLWNGSIEAVRAAYHAGKSIAAAVEAGIRWIRQHAPDAHFDVNEYRQAAEATLQSVHPGAQPVGAEAGQAVARIEEQADVQPAPQRTREFSGTKRKRVLELLRSPSSQVLYYGTPDLLRGQNKLRLEEAYRANALMQQTRALFRSIWESAAGKASKWSLPKWMRRGAWARAAREYMRRVLPLAAHLNATGTDESGAFKFDAFEMRVGLMPVAEFTKAKHQVGGKIVHINPLTEQDEELTIGPLVTTAGGATGYQLTRAMTAEAQRQLYDHYRNQYPHLSWLVDMFIDPSLKDARMTINGIQVPVFNRFASAAMMAEGHPDFHPLQAYTPDVIVTRSLLGALKSALFNPKAGSTSPGRRYKTGRSRESGQVRDLISGWSVRTWQMLTEQSHRQWAQELIKSATAIPKGGVPDGWTQLDMGMIDLASAVRRLRHWESPAQTRDVTREVDEQGETAVAADLLSSEWLMQKNGRWYVASKVFPEIEARLSSKGDLGPERDFPSFLGEVYRIRGKQLMLPTPLVNAIKRRFANEATHGRLWHLANWLVRQSVGSWLLHPKTFVANILTNDVFAMETMFRYTLSGLMTWNGRDLRFARNLFASEFLHRSAALRQLLHVADKTGYMQAIRTILPDQIFAGSTGLSDLQMDAGRNPFELLSRGDITGAALQATGYGGIDVRAKQRMAYAFLLAEAQTRTKAAGLKGRAFTTAVRAYMLSPPMDDRVRAIEVANFELLNYADTPEAINAFGRHWAGKLIMPFPRFGYHYLKKQGTRVAALKTVLSKVPAKQRANALADLAAFGVFGLGGGGALAYALASLFGGDEDDEVRKFVGTSVVKYIDEDGNLQVKDIDRSMITANRVNLSYWARSLGLGGEGEKDFWLRVRNYPVVAMAGAVALSISDARKYGVAEGARTYATTVGDLAQDFFSVGTLPKVGDRTVAWLRTSSPDRPAVPFLDPYSTRVPLPMYLTEQAVDQFIPGSRQWDEIVLWVDPTERRRTAAKTLDYQPGVMEGIRIGHVTGLIDRLLQGGESPLPPAGPIDRKTGEVTPKVRGALEAWSGLGGFNIRAVNREQYEKAIKVAP